MYFDERIDIHHLFPQDWCRQHNVAPTLCNSIVNKTPLSARTNRILGGNSPSVYIPRIQRSAGVDDTRMAQILLSHVIEPTSLCADNFPAFFRTREAALLVRIEQAMGKPIARDATIPVADEMIQEYQEDEEGEAEAEAGRSESTDEYLQRKVYGDGACSASDCSMDAYVWN
jgi:hypothetical protein